MLTQHNMNLAVQEAVTIEMGKWGTASVISSDSILAARKKYARTHVQLLCNNYANAQA